MEFDSLWYDSCNYDIDTNERLAVDKDGDLMGVALYLIIRFVVCNAATDIIDDALNETLTVSHGFTSIWTSGTQISTKNKQTNKNKVFFSNTFYLEMQWKVLYSKIKSI